MASHPINAGEHPPIPETMEEFVVESLRHADRVSAALNALAGLAKSAEAGEIVLRRFSDLSAMHLFIAAEELGIDLPADIDGSEECEGCNKLVRPNDPKHVCADGPVLCVVCAPTWRDGIAQYESVNIYDEEWPESLAAFQLAYKAHIEAGGAVTDKWLTHEGGGV